MDRHEPLLSTAELAAYLGVPISTIYAWRYAQRGPRGIVVGKHLRFRVSDVNDWLDAQAEPLRAGA